MLLCPIAGRLNFTRRAICPIAYNLHQIAQFLQAIEPYGLSTRYSVTFPRIRIMSDPISIAASRTYHGNSTAVIHSGRRAEWNSGKDKQVAVSFSDHMIAFDEAVLLFSMAVD